MLCLAVVSTHIHVSIVFSGFLFFLVCASALFFAPPLGKVYYPQVFLVSRGETVRSIGEELRGRHIINSPSLFVLSSYVFGGKVLWGSYQFSSPRGVFFWAWNLYTGDKDMPLRRIVIPERSNAYDIADILEKSFERF